jgi:putative flippase GtrA
MFMRKSFRFLSVGAINTLIGYLVIVTLKYFAGTGDIVANVLGYSIGLAVSYALNSRWTFQYKGRDRLGVPRFLIVVGVAYLANLATVMAVIGLGDEGGYIAQGAGIVPYALISYFGCRLWAFSSAHEKPGSVGVK